MLGADWMLGGGAVGVLLSHSRGEGGYDSPQGAGAVEGRLTGLYPYGRLELDERFSVWGAAGHGKGDLTLTPERGEALKADMTLTMAAGGGRGILLEPRARGGVELAAKFDGMVVRTGSEAVPGALEEAKTEVMRFRLGLEATWRGLAAGGGRFTPTLDVGVRHRQR